MTFFLFCWDKEKNEKKQARWKNCNDMILIINTCEIYMGAAIK